MADRYTLIVLADIFCKASDVINLQSNCSEVGMGGVEKLWQNSRYLLIPVLYVFRVDGASPFEK